MKNICSVTRNGGVLPSNFVFDGRNGFSKVGALLDMIRFGWRSQGHHRELQRLSRQLYDECEFPVRYEEGQSVLYRVLQEDRYPRKFYYHTVFEQRLKKYWITPGQHFS
ncbi:MULTISPECIES: hypothetical protein [Paenibacillus]|uniref:Uncharacterized protein n=1 Tax=Paenibacillus albilobatus TaxID=2716884 RepID=A0A919XEA0_9BACL|nr:MULTISPECIES: hypothetical protein [Paenibacillus]GIO29415.1 hypothetical protein J2TS6_05560 [Paenibacillus albilobatus]